MQGTVSLKKKEKLYSVGCRKQDSTDHIRWIPQLHVLDPKYFIQDVRLNRPSKEILRIKLPQNPTQLKRYWSQNIPLFIPTAK